MRNGNEKNRIFEKYVAYTKQKMDNAEIVGSHNRTKGNVWNCSTIQLAINRSTKKEKAESR